MDYHIYKLLLMVFFNVKMPPHDKKKERKVSISVIQSTSLSVPTGDCSQLDSDNQVCTVEEYYFGVCVLGGGGGIKVFVRIQLQEDSMTFDMLRLLYFIHTCVCV